MILGDMSALTERPVVRPQLGFARAIVRAWTLMVTGVVAFVDETVCCVEWFADGDEPTEAQGRKFIHLEISFRKWLASISKTHGKSCLLNAS